MYEQTPCPGPHRCSLVLSPARLPVNFCGLLLGELVGVQVGEQGLTGDQAEFSLRHCMCQEISAAGKVFSIDVSLPASRPRSMGKRKAFLTVAEELVLVAGCPFSDSEREVLGLRHRPRTMGNPVHGRLPLLHVTCSNKHSPSGGTAPFLSKSFLSIQDAQGNFAETSQGVWERRLYLTWTPMSSAPALALPTLCLSAAS